LKKTEDPTKYEPLFQTILDSVSEKSKEKPKKEGSPASSKPTTEKKKPDEQDPEKSSNPKQVDLKAEVGDEEVDMLGEAIKEMKLDFEKDPEMDFGKWSGFQRLGIKGPLKTHIINHMDLWRSKHKPKTKPNFTCNYCGREKCRVDSCSVYEDDVKAGAPIMKKKGKYGTIVVMSDGTYIQKKASHVSYREAAEEMIKSGKFSPTVASNKLASYEFSTFMVGFGSDTPEGASVDTGLKRIDWSPINKDEKPQEKKEVKKIDWGIIQANIESGTAKVKTINWSTPNTSTTPTNSTNDSIRKIDWSAYTNSTSSKPPNTFSSDQEEVKQYRELYDIAYDPVQIGEDGPLVLRLHGGHYVPLPEVLAKHDPEVTLHEVNQSVLRLGQIRNSNTPPLLIDVLNEIKKFKSDETYADSFVKRTREPEDDGGDEDNNRRSPRFKKSVTIDENRNMVKTTPKGVTPLLHPDGTPLAPVSIPPAFLKPSEKQPVPSPLQTLTTPKSPSVFGPAIKKTQYALKGVLAELDPEKAFHDVCRNNVRVEIGGLDFLMLFRERLLDMLRKKKTEVSKEDDVMVQYVAMNFLANYDQSETEVTEASAISNLLENESLGLKYDVESVRNPATARVLFTRLAGVDISKIPSVITSAARENAKGMSKQEFEGLSKTVARLKFTVPENDGSLKEFELRKYDSRTDPSLLEVPVLHSAHLSPLAQYALFLSPVLRNIGLENIVVHAAILDTGAEMNVIPHDAYQAISNYVAVDKNFMIVMHDANGGRQRLFGMISDASVQKAGMGWLNKIWILPPMEHPPFALLLGQPFGYSSQLSLSFRGADMYVTLRDLDKGASVEVMAVNSKNNERMKIDPPRMEPKMEEQRVGDDVKRDF
jgi:hypothetical protein